jgi:peptidoglycan L-alanyl-D-glutamate endopeptidase CwlK
VLPTLRLGSSGYYVHLLQMNLNGLALNYNGFAINGFLDTKTDDALKNFQDRFKLVRDGIVGPKTWSLLLENVKAIQRLLISRGYPVGNVDGFYGTKTMQAVQHFQSGQALAATGTVDPRTRQRLFNPNDKDHYELRPSSNEISALNPNVQSMARNLLALTKAHGLDVRITQAFRSWSESDRLFAQGRTTPGQIVSNARGGESFHNWGLAFDAAPYVNGQMSNDTSLFKLIGSLGKQAGLEWGGDFKSLVDYPHFQYTHGLNTWDLLHGVRPRHS